MIGPSIKEEARDRWEHQVGEQEYYVEIGLVFTNGSFYTSG